MISKKQFNLVAIFLALLLAVAPTNLVMTVSAKTVSFMDITVASAEASSKTPPKDSLVDDATDTLSFQDLGFDELTLQGPFAANGYYFDLPPTWSLIEGAELRLVFDLFFTRVGSNPQIVGNSTYGGTLLVQYNYINVATIDLNQEGRQQINVSIPLDVLSIPGKGQSQSIQFILDSGVNCDVDFRTTVVVRTSSILYLPHDLIDPPVDLRYLPSPLYLDSFNDHPAVIVVPDNPTAGELQAALTVSAGFGRMTFNRLNMSLLPVGKVDQSIVTTSNLILVGKPGGIPLLQQLPLPAPFSSGKYLAEGYTETDGIIQMSVSPWNKSLVVMVVGGIDDSALIMAARALSTGTLRVGKSPSVSLVSSVQTVSPNEDKSDVDQTFANLGYESAVVSEIGLNTVSYRFDVPQSYTLGPDAYLDLIYSHTSLLEYDRSSIVVRLNEEPVGSVRLSDDTSSNGEAKILLPSSAVRPGSNRLRLDIIMEPRNECVDPLLEGLWMRIDSSSSLHLPFVPNPANTSILLDLKRYPSSFAFDPMMNDLAFVLAQNDPIGWNIANKIAFSLGSSSAIKLAGLETYYADAIPDAGKQERNQIIIGKPSRLKVISELYDVLPAPFEPGADLALEKNLQVSYRLSPGVDVGYVELLQSPWNHEKNLLYIGGSSDTGLQWAGDSLLYGRLQSQLKGNLAFINGDQIVAADTRVLQGVQGVLATAVPLGLTTGPDNSQQQALMARPSWMLPMIYVSSGGVILVLIVLGLQSLKRKRSG